MKVRDLVKLIPYGQIVAIKDYMTDNIYYHEDVQYLKDNRSQNERLLNGLNVKSFCSQNDVEFEDTLVIWI